MDVYKFASTLIGYALDGCDSDGGTVQDLAEKCGLIIETKYDPEKHGADGLSICDPGDPWFVLSHELEAMRTR